MFSSFVFASEPVIQDPLHGSDLLTGFQICHGSKNSYASMGSHCFCLIVFSFFFLVIFKHCVSLLLLFFCSVCFFFSCLHYIFHVVSFLFSFHVSSLFMCLHVRIPAVLIPS